MKCKQLAIALGLALFAVGANAMEKIDDVALSQTTGQDGGINIAANLNISVGNFTWVDGSGDAGFALQNISINGAIAAELNMMSATDATADIATVLGVTAIGGTAADMAANKQVLTTYQTSITNYQNNLVAYNAYIAAVAAVSAGTASSAQTLLASGSPIANPGAAPSSPTAAQLAPGRGATYASYANGLAGTSFMPTGDVVKIALPDIQAAGINIGIGSISTYGSASVAANGGNGISLSTDLANKSATGGTNWGSVGIYNLQMGGTTAYIWVK